MATVYVRNLEEKVALTALKEQLARAVSEFGPSTIYAKKSLKMRGQAFVDFESEESAKEAISKLNGTEMFGKPIFVAQAKARTRGTVAEAPAKKRKLDPHNVLFVKNVEDQDKVRAHFGALTGFVEARLAKNVGFIEFDTVENATAALGEHGAEFATKD